MLNLEAGLRIDKSNLDEEVANLPSVFYTVSDHYLEALKHSKRLQQRADRTFAKLAAAIRSASTSEESNNRSRGITETQIKQEVLMHPLYRKIKAKQASAQYVQDRWSALKDAYVQKSFSLKGLVSLAVSEQYQSPHSTRR